MIAFIAILAGLVYSFGVGVTYAIIQYKLQKDTWETPAPTAALVWPVLLPIMLGVMTSRRILARISRPELPEARVIKKP